MTKGRVQCTRLFRGVVNSRLLLSPREPLPLREKSSERPAGILASEDAAPIASGFFFFRSGSVKNVGNESSWPAGRGEGVNSLAGRLLSLYLYHSRNGCFVTPFTLSLCTKVVTKNFQHKKPSWKKIPNLDQSIRRWAEP